MAVPQINTYHCLCSSLLLATTHTLSSLPRRAPPSLDSAIIVPLPPAPQPPASSRSSEDGSEAEDTPSRKQQEPKQPQLSELGYTLLLSTTLDRRPTLTRRSDGFERRYLVRCGRCRLIVGYELDAEHYAAFSGVGAIGSSEAASAMDVDGEGKEEKMKVMYLLPGGIMSTETMASGKKIGEKEVALGERERTAVAAAWE